jgi:hypothetical protein
MKAIFNALGDAEAYCCSHMAGNRGAVLGSPVLRELLRMDSHSARGFGLAVKGDTVNA